MQNSNMVRIIAFVKGRVQGVGFRYFTKRTATKMNLTGFVQNTLDGKVKILAEGDRNSINKFINIIKIGPHSASVEDVDIKWLEFENEFDSFTIKL